MFKSLSILWFQLVIRMNCLPFVLAPNLPKVTAVVGLWGWTGVSLAVVALVMLYKCSR